MAAVVEPVLGVAAAERARLINQSRAELLRSGRVVDVALFARSKGKSVDAARKWLNRQRTDGRLVYVVHAGNTYVPLFQFDEAFDLDGSVSELVSFLVDRDMSDWAVWSWFESPSGWLGRRAPVAAVAAGELSAVWRAAHGLFQE